MEEKQGSQITGFFSKVGLASGVSMGIQKLGRLWVEPGAEEEEELEPGAEEEESVMEELAEMLALL